MAAGQVERLRERGFALKSVGADKNYHGRRHAQLTAPSQTASRLKALKMRPTKQNHPKKRAGAAHFCLPDHHRCKKIRPLTPLLQKCAVFQQPARTHCKSSHGSRCISLERLARREEGAYPKVCDRRATQPGASREATRRAGVLLPCGYVARSSRSCGYVPHSTPRRKAKSLPARPVSTFAMSSRTWEPDD